MRHLLFGLMLAASPLMAKPAHVVLPQFAKAGDRVNIIRPVARPALKSDTPPEQPLDLSHALPGKALAALPSSSAQLQALSGELKQGRPELASAKEKSDTLAAEAKTLRQKLIDTARRIEELERQKIDDAARIAQLTEENTRLSAGFANDRVAVTRLIAVLERLQHDMPPALAMRPGDALGAARGAMLVGASLPPVYAQAASLSRRIEALKTTRAALEKQRREADATTVQLTGARAELDRLLLVKQAQAQGAAQDYDLLKTRLADIAKKASDFQALLTRVKALRQQTSNNAAPDVVTVMAENAGSLGGLGKNALLEPVVGTLGTGPADQGATYATAAGAQVIAPADGKVLYAGPYHKSGQVLILEITTGYDAVLAGLGRITVKPNDQLLAGEPVGMMPPDTATAGQRLYFEVRHGGRGLNPAPWLKMNPRASARDEKKAKT